MPINKIYEELNSSAVAFPLVNYFSFNIFGKDTVRYLHGRITQDVKNLTIGLAKQSLVLTPQGKIQGQFWISKSEEGFLIVSDPLSLENQEEFKKNLLRFKVADDVQLSSSADRSIIAVQGAKSGDVLQGLGIECSTAKMGVIEGLYRGTKIICLSLSISKYPGFLLVIENSNSAKFLQDLSDLKVSVASEDEFNLFRISARLPVYGLDFNDNSIAPELFDLEEKISFTKGCYSGQEVVERATALGKAPKKIIYIEGPTLTGDLSGLEITNVNDSSQVFGKTIRGINLESENKSYLFGSVKTKDLEGEEFLILGGKFKKVV